VIELVEASKSPWPIFRWIPHRYEDFVSLLSVRDAVNYVADKRQ